MHDFFKVMDVAAFRTLLDGFPALPGENISLYEADGRVLAQDIVAGEDLPLADRSCMDGFAVRAADLFGASESAPGYLECVATIDIERKPDFTLNPGECAAIVTGGLLPQGADAVVMVEHTSNLESGPLGTVEFRKSVPPTEHVMLRGEDARAGETALAAGTVLRPQETGLLAALGFEECTVHASPRIGIISTGDELVEVSQTPVPGQVRDVNSASLAALAHRAGAVPTRYGLVPDREGPLRETLARALAENDSVFLSGGSSVGVRDLSLKVIDSLPESEVLAHGVAMSPGKPVIFARSGAKSIWGLPGQVGSAMVVMLVLGCPFLRHLAGDATALEGPMAGHRVMKLARNLPSKQGREDWVRVRIRMEDGQEYAEPVFGKSGLLRTLLQAQGMVRIPARSEGLDQGADVPVWLY